MVPTVVSAAVINPSVATAIAIAAVVIAGAAVVARTVITTVVIRRVVAGIVIGRGVNIVAAGVVVTTGQPQTEHRSEQCSTQHFLEQHGGLLKDL